MIELSSDTQVGKAIQQLVRYGVIGIGSNLVIYFLFLLATYVGLEPKKAMTLLYIFGASIGFFCNRKWTFDYSGNSIRTIVRYMIAHVFGYLLNLIILFTFVDRLGYAHQAVQAAAIIFVAGFLFVTFKYFVFPNDERCRRGGE